MNNNIECYWIPFEEQHVKVIETQTRADEQAAESKTVRGSEWIRPIPCFSWRCCLTDPQHEAATEERFARKVYEVQIGSFYLLV